MSVPPTTTCTTLIKQLEDKLQRLEAERYDHYVHSLVIKYFFDISETN